MKRLSSEVLVGIAFLCLAIVPLVGCGVPKSEYEALQNENAGLEAELAQAQADYATASGELGSANTELANIKKTYPPRYFADKNELDQWLSKQLKAPSNSNVAYWYINGLQLQQRASADGYIGLNVMLYYYETGNIVAMTEVVTQDKRVYSIDLCGMTATLEGAPFGDVAQIEDTTEPNISLFGNKF